MQDANYAKMIKLEAYNTGNKNLSQKLNYDQQSLSVDFNGFVRYVEGLP